MGGWGWLRRRLDVLFRKQSVEDELDDEIRFHIEMEIRRHLAGGLSPEEARRRALVAFGGVERFKEEVRDVRGARVLDDFVQDARVAARSFAKEPAFLAAVLVTLGLGIGGNVAMFGILDASLLRALPYQDPARLVLGRVTYDGEVGNTVSGPDYFDYRAQATSLAGLSAFTPFEAEATVTGRGEAERVLAPYASTDLFQTLGVVPIAGRAFLLEEGEPGGPAVTMLEHGYWARAFASDPGVVGSTLTLDGTPTTIVGVLPAAFRFPTDADVWRPIVRDGAFAGARQFHNFVLVGRLATGVELAAAQAEVDGISARLSELYPDTNRNKGLSLAPLQQALAERHRPTLLLLAASMLLLLLVACANVGGMLLARGSARRQEMAVRASLGAGRVRLLRQLLAEDAVLVTAAGVVGVSAAGWLQRVMLALVSLEGLGGVEPTLSVPAVLVASTIAAGTVALFGALPAAAGARSIASTELRGRGSGGRAAARFRSGLVVAQVALTAVLLTMSGLLARSLIRLYGVETGFDPSSLLTAEVHLPPGKYQDAALRHAFYQELGRRAAELPDVEAVALVSQLPLRDPGNNVRVAPPEQWGRGGVFGRVAYQRMVLPGYFDAMGIPLVAGRDVTADDDRTSTNVMILSESLAEDLFPEGGALGRTLGVDVGGSEPWIAEVVGIVGDVAPETLASGAGFTMYFSYGQRSPASMRLAVRTRGTPASVVPPIRAILHELDPDVPLADASPMEEVVSASVADRRAVMVLLGTFALVALILAAVGLYGVIAYEVARRTREIGVRMALGASVSGVVRSTLRAGLGMVATGVLLGLPATILATRLIRSLLFEIAPGDPLTYAGATAFLGGVTVVACLLPARRAAAIDPAAAFRTD